MDKYVLRKTFGAWSAGTKVYEHGGEFQIGLYKDAMEVPAELVIKRRPMSGMVPLLNCKARKAIKREALQNG